MDNNEAIEWLKAIKVTHIHGGDEEYDKLRKEAIDTAIKSLERDRDSYDTGYAEGHIDGVLQGEKLYAPKLGEWNYIQAGMAVCPFCGATPHKQYKNFCPKCGAKMKKE